MPSIEELVSQAKSLGITLPDSVQKALAERQRILAGSKRAALSARARPTVRVARGGNHGNLKAYLLESCHLDEVPFDEGEDPTDFGEDDYGDRMDIESFIRRELTRLISEASI